MSEELNNDKLDEGVPTCSCCGEVLTEEDLEALYEDEDDEEFWLIHYGMDYMKYRFEGIESFEQLSITLRALAVEFGNMSEEYEFVEPIDGGHVFFARKDGRHVYEHNDSTLTLAKYED